MIIDFHSDRLPMSSNLKKLELSVLYDLLAARTTQYTHIMRWGSPSDNLKECQDIILELQSEIDFRENQADIYVRVDEYVNDGLQLPTTGI